jgi:PAS domain S-box-containing protein
MKHDDSSWLPLLIETDVSQRTRSPGRLRRYLLTALAMSVGLAITVTSFSTAQQLERLRAERDFDSLADERVRAVAQTMNAYVLDIFATRALFDASEFVSRSEFKRFVSVLRERQSGIRALEWIPRVAERDLASYEAAARKDGYAFLVRRLHSDKAGPRDRNTDFYPVFYVEPYAGNEAAFGIDLGSDLVRAEALERARDTGRPAATVPLDLVQDPEQAKSTLVFLAYYRGQTPPQTIAERREMLAGFVLGVVSFPDLLRDATSLLDASDINVALLYDETLLADLKAEGEGVAKTNSAGTANPLERIEPLEMGGRGWVIRCTPTAVFLSSLGALRPMLALLFCLALTILGTAYVYMTLRAAEMRLALAQSETRFRTVVEHAPEGILVISVDQGRFIEANENACRMFGLSREQLQNTSLLDISAPIQANEEPAADAAKAYIQRALEGATPAFVWYHLDGTGNEFPCEVRLVLLPSSEGPLVRGSITDITERVRSEQRQALLMRELDHRVKNNLATVLSLTEQSAADADSVDELRRSLTGRIRAIADLHRRLAHKQWEGMDLAEVLALTFAAYNNGEGADRIQFGGDPFTIPPETCTALCMVTHELATNAVKYGALSQATGRVDVTWKAVESGIEIEWVETGGPATQTPEHSGYGTRLISGLVQHELGGRVNTTYPSGGLRCKIFIPLALRRETTQQPGPR